MSERKEYWKNVIEEAQRDLAEMRDERREREIELQDLNVEIVKLERLLSSLAPMVEEVPADPTIRVDGVDSLELADAIREVLKQSEQFRTPRGVRDSLRTSGYDLDQHTNPLASIHGVLKRLVSSGEAEPLESNSKTYYRWKITRPQDEDIIEAFRRSLGPREHGPFDADLNADPKTERERLETRLKKRG